MMHQMNQVSIMSVLCELSLCLSLSLSLSYFFFTLFLPVRDLYGYSFSHLKTLWAMMGSLSFVFRLLFYFALVKNLECQWSFPGREVAGSCSHWKHQVTGSILLIRHDICVSGKNSCGFSFF